MKNAANRFILPLFCVSFYPYLLYYSKLCLCSMVIKGKFRIFADGVGTINYLQI